MRSLEEDLLSPLAVVAAIDASASVGGTGNPANFTGWLSSCRGLWYNLSLIVPSALFVAFLASQARKSLTKLSYGRSYIMISYYGLLWAVSLFNLLWCVVQSIYIFILGIPLFIDNGSSVNKMKWGLWAIHKLLLTAVYGIILFIHHSKWRERLPARPMFYNYIVCMFLLNVVGLLSCGLLGNGGSFGVWLFNLSVVCYHSLYLPLLYVTFLADFFQVREEDLNLENAYYSEMRDAGFFDADWD